MPITIYSQAAKKLVTLMPRRPSVQVHRAGMSFVNYYQLGSGPEEVVSPTIRLDVIHRYDHDRMHLKQGLPHSAISLQARGRRRQHKLGRQIELREHLALPLLRQM